MDPTPACQDFASDVYGLVAGDLDATRVASLESHARLCGACAALVRRERSLRSWLIALPDAPPLELRPPRLPDEPAGRLIESRTAWAAGAAAAAAALFAAWVLLPERSVTDATGEPSEVSTLNVVDTDDVLPAWDDGLFGLVAGAEAVASRRLAEDR